MPLIVITPPTSEPVTVPEAKESPAFRVTDAADDLAIGSLIKTARELGEAITKRAFLPTTYEYVLDEFPFSEIILPCPPLVSVTSIKYIDTNGAEQTLAPSTYAVDVNEEPGVVRLAYGKSWPGTRDFPNCVRVRYLAGYASATVVPAAIKTWIMMRAGTMYDNPHAIALGSTVMNVIPRDFIDGLLDPFRVVSFR
jgi:uncharacterized phiE125 gp8 family phage protein